MKHVISAWQDGMYIAYMKHVKEGIMFLEGWIDQHEHVWKLNAFQN